LSIHESISRSKEVQKRTWSYTYLKPLSDRRLVINYAPVYSLISFVANANDLYCSTLIIYKVKKGGLKKKEFKTSKSNSE
jgi:hypothetical protein